MTLHSRVLLSGVVYLTVYLYLLRYLKSGDMDDYSWASRLHVPARREEKKITQNREGEIKISPKKKEVFFLTGLSSVFDGQMT